ncbi:MAG: Tol-Pal system beta propeller repeat protein TolB [Holosporaceae bacterium]|jgi:TolB protein|nr:Tol-Pal system beta propeller repeat protein TolB [Holosporaceae bacterium]
MGCCIVKDDRWKRHRVLSILLAMVCSFFCRAATVVDVKQGVMKPVSVAVSVFSLNENVAEDIYLVIVNDLVGTFLFKELSRSAFMQALRGAEQKPTFPLWKMIGTQYLVNVEVQVEGETLRVTMKLYDVLSETQVGTFTASSNTKEWRRLAHLAANNVYERVTGEQGYFETKILYVSVKKTPRGGRNYRIAIMDQDGYDHKFLTDSSAIVLTPRFAPDGREFSFFSIKEKIVRGRRIPISANVYRYNLSTQRIELVASFSGMSYAPRYSPDGKLLIFSLSHRGSSSIYTFDLVTHRLSRVTKGTWIDTSPCYSPDGKNIVFTSDRGGSPQLYIMDADGSNVRRLTFAAGCRYTTPTWSPRGDWIAFTRSSKEGFYIGIMHPDGSWERMLASGYIVEGPTWSPNGRVVLFSHQDYQRREKIFSVDVTGYNKHEINTPLNAIDPEWSTKQ